MWIQVASEVRRGRTQRSRGRENYNHNILYEKNLFLIKEKKHFRSRAKNQMNLVERKKKICWGIGEVGIQE